MAGEDEVTAGFGHSLTDLMTSIAVIFILFFLIFVDKEMNRIEAQRKEIQKQEQQTDTNRDLILKELSDEFRRDAIVIEPDPNDPLSLVMVLRDDPQLLSFEYREARVRAKGRDFLEDIVPRLAGIVCSKEVHRDVDSLIIEGHTDSRGGDDENTQLSARRATAVMVYARRILAGLDGELEKCFLSLSRATGRGKQELIQADGQEDRDASRRVVVKVRVKSWEQRKRLSELAGDRVND